MGYFVIDEYMHVGKTERAVTLKADAFSFLSQQSSPCPSPNRILANFGVLVLKLAPKFAFANKSACKQRQTFLAHVLRITLAVFLAMFGFVLKLASKIPMFSLDA